MNQDRSLMDVVVGDRLIIDPASFRRPGHEPLRIGQVTKVARKYLTVHWANDWRHPTRWEHDTQFARETGKERVTGGYSNYLDDAYTIDGWGVKVRRDAVDLRLQGLRRDHGQRWAAMSTDQLERIADIVEGQDPQDVLDDAVLNRCCRYADGGMCC